MSARAQERLKRAYRRTLDLALAASLAAHLFAFAVFPRGKTATPAAPEPEPFRVVETESYPVPPSPPPPPPRPRVLGIDESVEEEDLLPDATFDPTATDLLRPPPAPVGAFVVFQEPPRVLRALTPEYPASARSAGIEGTVRLLVTVDAEGRVVDATVLRADARVFERPALEAVRHWRFAPARQSGQPVAATVVVPVRFSLR